MSNSSSLHFKPEDVARGVDDAEASHFQSHSIRVKMRWEYLTSVVVLIPSRNRLKTKRNRKMKAAAAPRLWWLFVPTYLATRAVSIDMMAAQATIMLTGIKI